MSEDVHRQPLEFVSAPRDTSVDFLDVVEIPVGIRNRTHGPISLEEIALAFQPSATSVPVEAVTVHHRCKGQIQGPGALEYEKVRVCPSLLFQPWTNVFTITARYRSEGPSGVGVALAAVVAANEYIIVNNAPNFSGKLPRASVFISFKDPQDAELAGVAAELVRRAGFSPYLARNDERPGSNYWEDKIQPAIESAEATLVIWTPNTLRQPDTVLRELRYSQEVGTPAGLFLEDATELPRDYPASIREYGGPFVRRQPWESFAREIEAAARRWREDKTFF
jgi:hypothetical protein